MRTGTADPFGPTLRYAPEHALSHREVKNEIRARKRHRVNFARFVEVDYEESWRFSPKSNSSFSS